MAPGKHTRTNNRFNNNSVFTNRNGNDVHNGRSKNNNAKNNGMQVNKKPAESLNSEIFKMKRTFIRTFIAIDTIITEKFGKHIFDVVKELDEPARQNLQSRKVDAVFNAIDTKIGSLIQPPKSVTQNSLKDGKNKLTIDDKVMDEIKQNSSKIKNLQKIVLQNHKEQNDLKSDQVDEDLLDMSDEEEDNDLLTTSTGKEDWTEEETKNSI